MEDRTILKQNRSEFFSKILKALGGVLVILFLPKRIFSKHFKPLEIIEIKEHPHSVKREKKGR